MKKISLFGNKSLNSLVFSILMLLPMFSILGRVIYTQSNPNAKDNYSDVTIYKTYNIDFNTYDSKTIYNLKYQSPSTNNESVVPFSYMSITYQDLGISQFTYDTLSTWSLRSDNTVAFGDGNTYNLVVKSLTLDIFKNFNFKGVKLPSMFSVFDVTFVDVSTEKIDNAFEYSLSTFVEDNNVGALDLFGWFEDVFLDSTNAKNHLYCSFINWYLNYALLVSCAFLIYVFLIWFVSYIRILMDKFLYKDYGGF